MTMLNLIGRCSSSVSSWTDELRGHCSWLWSNHSGPCHLKLLSLSSWTETLLLARSAGLSSDLTWNYCSLLASWSVLATLLATNVVEVHVAYLAMQVLSWSLSIICIVLSRRTFGENCFRREQRWQHQRRSAMQGWIPVKKVTSLCDEISRKRLVPA